MLLEDSEAIDHMERLMRWPADGVTTSTAEADHRCGGDWRTLPAQACACGLSRGGGLGGCLEDMARDNNGH